MTKTIYQAIKIVALLNFLYFFVEFWVALKIDSISLFADSVDFLEDASVNLLILLALGWPLKARAKMGMALSLLLLWPALAVAYGIYEKIFHLTQPDSLMLSLTGLGALLINVTCAFLLAQHKHHDNSLMKAAFYSARNDAISNIAIIFTGILTLYVQSGLPDLLVGLGIVFINLDAAHKVWKTARNEHLSAKHDGCA